MSGPVDAFVPLARLILGDGYSGQRRERWTRPLAQLLEAASRGKGQLPLSRCDVGADAPATFFAIADGMVLLPRHAACWREVRAGIEERWGQPIDRLPDAAVRDALDAILPPFRKTGPDDRIIFDNARQRLAAAAFVDARIGVLTGGPGTGKTTSAATLLAIRKRLDPGLRAADVLLCAPTGKAACRLGESMQKAAVQLHLDAAGREFLCALVPATLHKALEWTPKPPEQGGPFRRCAVRPLTQRLVLIDEASMVDLDLMTHLLRALPATTALLLLGDSDQLESVETGGILGELVSRGTRGGPAAGLQACWQARLGELPGDPAADGAMPQDGAGALPGLVVRLLHSHRAMGSPWILELAAIARPGGSGTVADFLACCRRHAPHILLHERRSGLLAICRTHWQETQQVTDSWSQADHPGQQALSDLLRRFQLLCSDNAQVDRANRLGVALLRADRTEQGGLALPHGCPVLITQNRPALGLSNGDVGIALGPQRGSPAQVVVFPGIASPIPIAQLPEHQPAFALTIHKSQGSEWRQVAIDLPAESELLDRNLLYTALTRSSGTLDLSLPGETALATILAGE